MSDSFITQHYYFYDPAAGTIDQVKNRLRLWGSGRVVLGEKWRETDDRLQYFLWTVPEGVDAPGSEYCISPSSHKPDWAWDNASRVADLPAAWAIYQATFSIQVDGNRFEGEGDDLEDDLWDVAENVELIQAELLQPGVIMNEFGRIVLPAGVRLPVPPEWFVIEHATRYRK